VAKAWQAAEHLDQKLTSLGRAAADHLLADFRQHLDLEAVRCAEHANEARDLRDAASPALGQAQPRRLAVL